MRAGLNPYAYVNADPVNLVDPDGLWLVPLVAAALAASRFLLTVGIRYAFQVGPLLYAGSRASLHLRVDAASRSFYASLHNVPKQWLQWGNCGQAVEEFLKRNAAFAARFGLKKIQTSVDQFHHFHIEGRKFVIDLVVANRMNHQYLNTLVKEFKIRENQVVFSKEMHKKMMERMLDLYKKAKLERIKSWSSMPEDPF